MSEGQLTCSNYIKTLSYAELRALTRGLFEQPGCKGRTVNMAVARAAHGYDVQVLYSLWVESGLLLIQAVDLFYLEIWPNVHVDCFSVAHQSGGD